MEETSAAFLFEEVLDQALQQGCTDIHLFLSHTLLEIKFRVQGLLVPFLVTESPAGTTLVRRIKALARMDVTDARIPQDGSFRWDGAVPCDIRVSSLPLVDGECIVLRLLSGGEQTYDFHALGFNDLQVHQLVQMLSVSGGLMLLVGPTGSGKTTTLYAMMHWLAEHGRHVISLEDPVERSFHEFHQFEVREKVGLTFAAGLRAALRQDPDVIVVGEVRDDETARIILRAALTGHLVLTTTHAIDLVGAAERLWEFGLSRPLLADVLVGVVVQTMVDKPCLRCHGRGCSACNGGVARRRPHFVVHRMTSNLRNAIASTAPWHTIRSSGGIGPDDSEESVGYAKG
ncbi:MAG: Flp pilus assembly complex ATPase component TadA [Alicyclobacillus herbarius]|uniref:GspE/PulE family protein n=1 Tax=Alicyclobacillus herbarius TaxID=122960 RepID=UPI0023571A2C|nr:ATPase, T2SS/T4P/T4SS family [Alicyclobacillus herbarius]MCL6631629.1 Flp pilus assembly complex ATPase component TadA [Alicyclobacillus herbarius]